MKNYILIGGAIVVVVLILVITKPHTLFYSNPLPEIPADEFVNVGSENDDLDENGTTSTEEELESSRPSEEVIGKSAEGRDIIAYTFGEGETEVLLLSGIHGGYAWNTALLGFELRDWLRTNEANLGDVRVTIIPVINPDGLYLVTGTVDRFLSGAVSANEQTVINGRFNNNVVDLNRNFDCEWQRTGTWQSRAVSGGSEPFSEPESQAIRDYVMKYRPAAAIAYYSTAGGVYASTCRNGILNETRELLSQYGTAAGYTQFEEFDYYEITGDMVNWLAREQIPAISVLLGDKNSTEFTKNRAGLESIIKYYNER